MRETKADYAEATEAETVFVPVRQRNQALTKGTNRQANRYCCSTSCLYAAYNRTASAFLLLLRLPISLLKPWQVRSHLSLSLSYGMSVRRVLGPSLSNPCPVPSLIVYSLPNNGAFSSRSGQMGRSVVFCSCNWLFCSHGKGSTAPTSCPWHG